MFWLTGYIGIWETFFLKILYPEDVSYVYEVKPARTFGGLFVSTPGNVCKVNILILCSITQCLKSSLNYSLWLCMKMCMFFKALLYIEEVHEWRNTGTTTVQWYWNKLQAAITFCIWFHWVQYPYWFVSGQRSYEI